MGRKAFSPAFLALLAAVPAMGQTTTTTSSDTTSTTTASTLTSTSESTTTTTPLTTVVPTTITTDIVTVISDATVTTPVTTVVSTTITLTPTSESTSETTAETTVITTDITTDVTTVIDSTTTVTEITTETVTTVTVTSDSSTLTTTGTESTSSTTTTNAPQYTGATFHIESTNGDVGQAAPLPGDTAKDLIFDVRSEFTIDGFGHLVSRGDGYIAMTNGGSESVYTDVAPTNSRVKRQTTGTPLTCSVATTGVLACTGASGAVFYTDGTNLYLGDDVPAGFQPITLIAVIDAAVTSGTSSSTVAPTGPLPTAGPTTPGYAGWGQWSYPQPTGVPVALTTTIVVPGPGGLQTQTVTVTSLHCGCTETPLPTKIVMTTYVTNCPTEWGYTAPVTVAVPVKPTGAVWGGAGSGSSGSYDNSGWVTYGSTSGSGSGSGSSSGSGTGSGSKTGATGGSSSGNGTWNNWNAKPYTGAASPVGVSASLLTLSVAMLAFLL